MESQATRGAGVPDDNADQFRARSGASCIRCHHQILDPGMDTSIPEHADKPDEPFLTPGNDPASEYCSVCWNHGQSSSQ